MTDHEAELEKVCAGLERRFADFRRNREKGPDPEPINPDGPAAARLLREMAAENERLRGAIRSAQGFHQITHVHAALKDALTKGKPHD